MPAKFSDVASCKKDITAELIEMQRMRKNQVYLLCLSLCGFFAPPLVANELDPLFSLPLEDLMNIEIYAAGKTSEKIKDIPASVILITRSDIEKYGYTTLTDVLENTPGLYNIYSYAGVSGNFGARGFWNPNSQNSNVAILVNGVSQAYNFDRSHPMDKINVPVEAIDRIEIIRGPMAVLYGNGASFGVINIVTNEVSDSNTQSLASFSYGSSDTKKAAFRLATKENNLKLVINAARYQTDGPDNKFTDMMSPTNAATLPALGITDPNYSTKNLLNQKSKYFGISGSYNNWIFDTAYNETEIGLFLLLPPLEDGYNRTSKNTSMMLGYQTAVSEMVDIDVRATYNNTERNDLAEVLVAGIDNTEVINFNSLEIEFLSTITPNDKTSIVAGLNYQSMSDLHDVIDGPSVGIINESYETSDRTTHAFFGQATYQAMDNLSLVAGVRYEDLLSYDTHGITDGGLPSQSTFGDAHGDIQTTSPRLAAIYSLDEHNIIKFLYGEANRLGDDELDPEITKTTEVNYIYSKADIFTSVSLFHNQFQDLVIKDIVLVGGIPSSEKRNSGKVTTNGVEFIINGDLSAHLFGEFSITLQDSTNEKNENIDVGYSPNAVTHAKLAYKNKDTTVATIGRYVGSMETLYDLTKQNPDLSYGARVGDETDEYYVLDLNIRQDNIYKSMYLNLKVSNLFDEKIRYPNNQETNELLNRGTIGAERMVIGTVGVKF
ncbi:MAG: TonB-dependent receptor [Porticoccus sp.]|nr:TonB-dependent receptor [Porticoccus sp.]